MKARVIVGIVLALAFVSAWTSNASADDFLELKAKLVVGGSPPSGTNPKANGRVEIHQRTSTSNMKASLEAEGLKNFNGVAVNIRRNGTVIGTFTVKRGKLDTPEGTFPAGFFTAGDVITVTTTAGVVILTGTLVAVVDD